MIMQTLVIKDGLDLWTIEEYNPALHPAVDLNDENAYTPSAPGAAVVLVCHEFRASRHKLLFDSHGNYTGFRDTRTGELVEGFDPETGETSELPLAFFARPEERDGVVGLLRIFGPLGAAAEWKGKGPLPPDHLGGDPVPLKDRDPDEGIPLWGLGTDGLSGGKVSVTPGGRGNPQSARGANDVPI